MVGGRQRLFVLLPAVGGGGGNTCYVNYSVASVYNLHRLL